MEKQVTERGNSALAVKSGVWYVVGTFITKGLAFLTTPLFARLMLPSDYGEFINFANWQSLLLIIVSAELFNTLSRAYYDYTEEYDQYASSVVILGVLLNIFFYVFFLVSRSWIFNIVAIPEKYVHLMFFVMLMQGARQVYQVKERTLYRYKSSAAVSVLSSVIPTVISIFIVLLVPTTDRLDARMYGFYIPYALIGIYCIFALLRNKVSFRWSHCKYAIVLALPLLVHYLTTYLLSSTNTIITKSCLGAEIAAMVSIAVSIMNILILLFQAASGALTTWIMDNLEKNNAASVRKCINYCAAAVVVICMAIMILAPELVLIIGGAKYKAAAFLIPGLTLAVFFQILSTFFTIVLTYRKKVVGTAVLTGVVAVISVLSRLYLLPRFGVSILPLVNAVSFGIVFLLNYLLIVKGGDAKCFQMKLILPMIAVVVLAAFACQYLYYNAIFRYAICGVCGTTIFVGLIIKREFWLSTLKRGLHNQK